MSLLKTSLLISCLFITSPLFAADNWEAQDDDDWGDEDSISSLQITGFVEARSGVRLRTSATQKKQSINEARVKTQLSQDLDNVSFKLNADLIADDVVNNQALNLQKGQGFIDLRELHVSLSPTDNLDLKIGRQILTWGTGDLIFINDLFSKDWRSFFNGRDDQYLKAPSDAIKASMYFDQLNLDVIYLPRYNSDRFINGQRLSYQGDNGQILDAKMPSSGDEFSLRAHRTFNGLETALYYYNGYSKSPAGYDQTIAKAIFPKLTVYGASVRGALAKGVFSAEVGYRDLVTPNADHVSYSQGDQYRALIGYEQELAKQLFGAIQYYVEVKKDQPNRQVITVRLEQQLMQQKLQLSAFNFYSPTDKDGYLRLKASYKYNDDLKLEIGSNLFFGKDQRGFFSQFKENNNLYAAIKLSY